MKTIQGLALLLAGSALCSTQAVFAQTAPDTPAPVADTAGADAAGSTLAPAADDGQTQASSQDIVVTGTLIRGVAKPTGSNLLTVSSAAIRSTGSSAAIDVLNQTVPQLPTLNSVSSGSASFATPVAKIALRGFGNTNGNSSGQTATLVLFNGHRIVPVGVLSTDPDPNLIPADALETVQVLPDGGSATYGSDAIGGVVNFVAKKRFDGLQMHYQHQFGQDYHENDVTLTAGTHWSTGSVLISAAYAAHDAIFGKDRDYITSDFTSHGGSDLRTTSCGYGNFTVNGTVYTAPNFQSVPSVPRCDQTDYTSLTPVERRVNVFAYLEQEITPSLKFSVDGIYGLRTDKVYTDIASIPSSITIDASNSYFRPVNGETSQTVSYNYSRGLGNARVSPQRFEQYQVDPSLTWTINDRWQLRGDFLYGHSTATIHDRTGLNGSAITATNFNPYDTSQTPSDVLANLADHEIYTRGVNKIVSGQIVANGTLFSLPGGDVKLAVGGEVRRQSLFNSTVTGSIGDRSGLASYDATRTVKAGFAELFVPVVGRENAVPFINALSLDAAVRYDHYSDFGGTTNPRFGIDYKPFEDLTLRGVYQTTFVAPSLADSGNKIDTRLQVLTLAPQTYLAFIAGAGQGLKPQTGRNYSIGGDYSPHAIRGLKLGLTYWNTKIDNLVSLSLGAYGFPGALSTAYNLCGAASPVQQCSEAYISSIQPLWLRLDNGGAPNIQSVADLFKPGSNIIGVVDARRANFGSEKLDGFDFNVSYNTDVSFGTIYGQIAGTYILNKKISATAGGAYQDYLASTVVNGQTPKYNIVGSLGATSGPVTTNLTIRRNGGYHVLDGISPGQSHVRGYTVTDVFVGYNLNAIGFMKGADIGVTVQNLFDADPPYYGASVSAGALSGYTNGGTLGRIVSLSLRGRF
ncbi:MULTISPECIES: TonB-dependent receptor plug domain-containing protein [unclassified Sphingobium]|uniref:TonB-dependent receptor plug domain-containing protein n=1 Tax=unclassified Sphingobium TaxID=2611147 RepID=UPI0034156836